MRWQSLVKKTISTGMSLTNLTFGSQKGLRILNYHSVGSSAYGDRLGLNTIKIKIFYEHIDILSNMSTVPLSPLTIPDDGLNIAITFDDGYADNLYVAAPLLVERGIPFTVFVTTGFIGEITNGFLTADELKNLALIPGVTIGSHSRTHRLLPKCTNKELMSELEGSKHYLEDMISKPVTSIAYPYGAADLRVRDAVQQAGYQLGFCSHVGINHIDRDKLMLNRYAILSEDTSYILKQKLNGYFDWYNWISPDPLKIKNTTQF